MTDPVTLRPPELQAMLDAAAETGARRALASLGLHDEEAAQDLRDLRRLLTDWRGVRRTVLEQIARALTTGVLALLALGAWLRWGGGER